MVTEGDAFAEFAARQSGEEVLTRKIATAANRDERNALHALGDVLGIAVLVNGPALQK
jgi:hypothetical protein